MIKLVLPVIFLVAAATANAQSNRTFVSAEGSDGNPCTLAMPCRTLAQAVNQTNANGEVAVLNTAGYGPVTISKAINIVNENGAEAGITATSGDAITITAGPSDVVTLRGLTLTGVGTGRNGITFTGGAALNIQNCQVSGFTQYGLEVQPAANAQFTIADTIASHNTIDGIFFSVQPGSQPLIFASLERVTLVNNGTGLQVSSGNNLNSVTVVSLKDSEISNNSVNGVSLSGSSGAVTVQINILQSNLIGNPTGLLAREATITNLSGVQILGLGTDINGTTSNGQPSPAIFSFGNNIFGSVEPGTTIGLTSFK